MNRYIVPPKSVLDVIFGSSVRFNLSHESPPFSPSSMTTLMDISSSVMVGVFTLPLCTSTYGMFGIPSYHQQQQTQVHLRYPSSQCSCILLGTKMLQLRSFFHAPLIHCELQDRGTIRFPEPRRRITRPVIYGFETRSLQFSIVILLCSSPRRLICRPTAFATVSLLRVSSSSFLTFFFCQFCSFFKMIWTYFKLSYSFFFIFFKPHGLRL